MLTNGSHNNDDNDKSLAGSILSEDLSAGRSY